MIVKLFEIRDDATCIAAIAIKLQRAVGYGDQAAAHNWLLAFAGWWGPTPAILFGKLQGGRLCPDPYDWPDNLRTMRAAHAFAEQHFDVLADGDVIDVRVVLGLRDTPVESNRFSGLPS